jgi:hypothetical protein
MLLAPRTPKNAANKDEEWPITGGRRTKHPQVEESLQIYKLLF